MVNALETVRSFLILRLGVHLGVRQKNLRQLLLCPRDRPHRTDAPYNQAIFYEAWRLIIQRYGIYNPYTERGAIKVLLPHGPHNVRDVLATHILKRTGFMSRRATPSRMRRKW
ncbi:hypothetical protein TPR58_14450 [Sphingomonas sp. HF-S3]|uniref:Integrase n=2 Tax=Sphingomonas rustica TaxID=3103142 RepID=A0ABV0BAW5_9SPHN